MCFREKQNTPTATKDTYATPVIEKSSLDELTNYTTLEQGLTMQYLTVSHNNETNQDAIDDAASTQKAYSTATQIDNVDSMTSSTYDSQKVEYSVINDGYETPQRQS